MKKLLGNQRDGSYELQGKSEISYIRGHNKKMKLIKNRKNFTRWNFLNSIMDMHVGEVDNYKIYLN